MVETVGEWEVRTVVRDDLSMSPFHVTFLLRSEPFSAEFLVDRIAGAPDMAALKVQAEKYLAAHRTELARHRAVAAAMSEAAKPRAEWRFTQRADGSVIHG